VRDLSTRVLSASTAQSKAKLVAASRGAAVLRDATAKRSKMFKKDRGEATATEREEEARQTRDAIAARMQKVIGAQVEEEEQALDFELMDLQVKETNGPVPAGIAAAVALLVSTFVTVVFALLSNVGHDLAGDQDDLREAGIRPLGKVTLPSSGRS
jgi:hypothetical protein